MLSHARGDVLISGVNLVEHVGGGHVMISQTCSAFCDIDITTRQSAMRISCYFHKVGLCQICCYERDMIIVIPNEHTSKAARR